MTRLRKLRHVIVVALTCKEVRPYEAAILRVVVAAILAQYGIKHF